MQYHSDGAEVAAEKHLNEFDYDQDMEDDQQNYKDSKEFEQGGDTDEPSNHSDEDNDLPSEGGHDKDQHHPSEFCRPSHPARQLLPSPPHSHSNSGTPIDSAFRPVDNHVELQHVVCRGEELVSTTVVDRVL